MISSTSYTKHINKNYQKYDREKQRNNYLSIYFPVSFYGLGQIRENSQKFSRRLSKANRSAPEFNEYLIEVDANKTIEPHFHVWRAIASSKISNSRSQGINLFSCESNGILYADEEKRSGEKLNETQTQEFSSFVDENRFLLFLIYEGMVSGKIKSVENFDEELIKNLFTKTELDRLTQKFNLKYSQINMQSERD